MSPKKRYIEEENEWDFLPYKNLRFIWEIDEKNKTSILHIKKKKEEKMNEYQTLKKELSKIEEELSNNKKTSHEKYTKLKKQQETIQEKIDNLPLIYEIWLSGYDGSMSLYHDPDRIIERYISKNKAYERLQELNNQCNYGEPYYMKINQLNG